MFARTDKGTTYGHLLLGDDHCAVLAPHAQGCDVRCRDRLECILWELISGALRVGWPGVGFKHTDLVEATLVGEDGDVSVVACASCMHRQLVSSGRAHTRSYGELATHQT